MVGTLYIAQNSIYKLMVDTLYIAQNSTSAFAYDHICPKIVHKEPSMKYKSNL